MIRRAAAIADLARPEIRGLALYSADQTACAIDLSDNTNLWGAPPAALEAIRDTASQMVSRYPSLYAEPLQQAIASYVGAPDASVVVGCGSDDVLDCAMRAFGGPGDAIAFSAPTFSMIPTFARMNGIEPVAVPFRPDFDLDAERLVATGAKLIYICAPNNPTATPASRAAVEFVVEHAPGVVVLDEAYAEFARATHADMLARSDRLLITRTFSKAFGLAGLRIGYGVGSRDLVGLVQRARGPYKVNVLAERAAAVALQERPGALGWVRAHASLAVENRERLLGRLKELGFAPLPSDANFVFVPTSRAAAISARLRAQGILVRTHANLPAGVPALDAASGAGLRIGVGPWEDMEALIAALRVASDSRASGAPRAARA